MKQSTRDILKRHGWRLDRALHNFVYFYFHKPYVKGALLLTKVTVKLLSWFKPAGFIPRFVFNRYHSKVLSTSDVSKILSLDHDLNLGTDRNKQVIPFKYANKVIIRNPKLIAVMDCPCVLNQPGEKCSPVGKCLAIGEDFAPIWLEHCREKYNARQITQEEALGIIKEARKTGHITQAFLKVATGGLTGVICNCCPKCCAGIKSTAMSKKIDPTVSQYIASGYSVSHNEEKCHYCGRCAHVCPFGLIEVGENGWSYRQQECVGCELCVENCPQEALSLYRDPEKLLPLDIDLLKEAWSGKE